jgi:hypothetical protein
MLTCVLATLLIPLLLTTPAAQAAPVVTCPGWDSVASLSPGFYNALYGVAAISTSDVWAVGDSDEGRALTEHWNGSNWSVIPILDGGGLSGVAAVSTNDVWAVGSGNGPLIEHWNGSSWTVVKSPSVGPGGGLSGVAALSATNVWAVGGYLPNSSSHVKTLIEHWNGSSWQVVPSPSVGSINNVLYGVAAISASDLWAVGAVTNSSYIQQTLIEHWNGTSWSIVTSPSPGSMFNRLNAVAAVSTNDVWAVGVGNGPLIEHWNGSSWKVVSSPTTISLSSVTAVSAHDVWAVGGGYGTGALIEHWNGSSWKVVKGAPVGNGASLRAVAQVPGTSQLWVVGYRTRGIDQGSKTLTERRC